MTDNTDNQLEIENAEIMAEIAYEKRMRREMDAHDIAAEQAEMRAEEDDEPTSIFRPVPPEEYGSLESRENAWAHAVLTGGE